MPCQGLCTDPASHSPRAGEALLYHEMRKRAEWTAVLQDSPLLPGLFRARSPRKEMPSSPCWARRGWAALALCNPVKSLARLFEVAREALVPPAERGRCQESLLIPKWAGLTCSQKWLRNFHRGSGISTREHPRDELTHAPGPTPGTVQREGSIRSWG